MLTLQLSKLKIFINTKVLKQRVLRSNLPVGNIRPDSLFSSNGYVNSTLNDGCVVVSSKKITCPENIRTHTTKI